MRFLFAWPEGGVRARGAPIDARPFPLSIGGFEARFSLSDDTDVVGDGDIDAVTRGTMRGPRRGAGEASYISSLNGEGDEDIVRSYEIGGSCV